MNIIRGVHGLDLVGLRRFFDSTHHDGLKKIQPITKVQSNPTHMGRVEPMGWTNFIIIIIIKLSRKKYKYKYIQKNQKLVSI